MRTHAYAALALHHREHPLAPFTRGYRYDRSLGEYDPVAGVDVTPRHVFVPDGEDAAVAHEQGDRSRRTDHTGETVTEPTAPVRGAVTDQVPP